MLPVTRNGMALMTKLRIMAILSGLSLEILDCLKQI